MNSKMFKLYGGLSYKAANYFSSLFSRLNDDLLNQSYARESSTMNEIIISVGAEETLPQS